MVEYLYLEIREKRRQPPKQKIEIMSEADYVQFEMYVLDKVGKWERGEVYEEGRKQALLDKRVR